MKKIKPLVEILLFFTIVLTSCEKEHFKSNHTFNQENSYFGSGKGLIVLGEKREDPYKLENMQKAYESLKSAESSSDKDKDKIKPTHKYIRFLPANETEWDILKSDTTLILYDFPLDYEIENMGTYYHDPTLPETSITWQYCVVPIKYKIPKIHNELIYEVYIPEEDNSNKSSELNKVLNELEYESAKLTGNLPKNIEKTKGLFDKWTPKGRIWVWDDIVGSTTTTTQRFSHYECYDCNTGDPIDCDGNDGPIRKQEAPIDICKRAVYTYTNTTTDGMYIPLNQVSVHARWFTNIKTDLTDENGNFETGQFLYEVNYAIKWERSKYDIRNGGLLQAWYNGPKKKGDWYLKIGKGGESIMYATMHRAAHKQFYGNNLGIRRPTGVGKTKLCYIDDNGTGVFWGDWIDVGILPDIKVWGKYYGSYKTTNEIFGTTTHELGHMSHWHLIGVDNYAFTGEIIYESWATAVEWALTNDEYHSMSRLDGNVLNYYHEERYQLNPISGSYTPVFIDLMDDYNQRVGGMINGKTESGRLSLPNDLIHEYSLSYIQDNILKDSRGIHSLKDSLYDNRLTGVTISDIDQLLALYW
ncbi:MAG: hypothetical protein PF517_13520 [Salinivirgaceae bacterium]|nr:hypothetical protein [Salinivirgaceae bacterium]